ncbi:MAG: GntR family transcriptional regulator [Pseudomonadales bacterium]|nr:GntR family transcriptional regulator [Pseudomonadales bacterium]
MSDSKLIALHVSPSSGIPIYRQLMDQIQRLIASESLAVGAELPSVRNLAEQHAINPMTVSKAYSALEMQGILTRLRGKGMIVSDNNSSQLKVGERLQQLDSTIEKLALEADQLGIEDEALVGYLAKLLKAKNRRSSS